MDFWTLLQTVGAGAGIAIFVLLALVPTLYELGKPFSGIRARREREARVARLPRRPGHDHPSGPSGERMAA